MRKLLLPVLAGVVLAGCSEEPAGLSGVWIGQNFQCPVGVSRQEEVQVSQVGERLEALKLTGDDCVPAGELTFHGTADALQCVIGVPENPASASYQGALLIIDEDSFEACGIRFTRKA